MTKDTNKWYSILMGAADNTKGEEIDPTHMGEVVTPLLSGGDKKETTPLADDDTNDWYNMLMGGGKKQNEEKPEDSIPEYLRRPEEPASDYDPMLASQLLNLQLGTIHNQLMNTMPETMHEEAARRVMERTPSESDYSIFDWSMDEAAKRAERGAVRSRAKAKAEEYLPEEPSFWQRVGKWAEGLQSPTIGMAGTSITPPAQQYTYSDALEGVTEDIISTLPKDENGNPIVNGLAYDSFKLNTALKPHVEAVIEPVLMRDRNYWDIFAQNRGFDSYLGMLDTYEAKLNELEKAIEPIDNTSSVALTNPNPNIQAGAVFAQAMGYEASGAKAIRDARDKINAMREGSFWSGVFEGGDLFSALTFGVSKLYSEAELYRILNKVYNGESLSDRERGIFDIYRTVNELEVLDNSFGRSWMREVGNAIGTTAEIAPQFIPVMGVASSVANLGKVGVKAGIGLTQRALRQGVVKGAMTGIKQTARVSGNIGLNILKANLGGLVVAPLQANTYSTYLQKRQNQFGMAYGQLVYKPTKGWKDFVDTLIEQTNETSSEILGAGIADIVGFSFKNLGKMIGLDKAVNGVSSSLGLGASYDKIFGVAKSDAWKALERRLTYAGDPISEGLSEIWGDISSNLMKMAITGNEDFSMLEDPRFWTTNLAVAAIYGTSLNMGHKIATMPNYMDIARLGRVKRQAITKIENKELANALRTIGVNESINEAAFRLANIDWQNIDQMQRAFAMDYIRAEALQQIAVGVNEENHYMVRFAPVAESIYAHAYKGKEGKEDTGVLLTGVLKDGGEVSIVSGDFTTDTSDTNLLMVMDEQGNVAPMARSLFDKFKVRPVADEATLAYESMFGEAAISQYVLDAEQEFDRLEEPTKEKAIDLMKKLSIPVPEEGDTVKFVDGREGMFLGWTEDGKLYVEAKSQDGEYELLTVPFHKLLSSELPIAQAQTTELAEDTLDAAKAAIAAEETGELPNETPATEEQTSEDAQIEAAKQIEEAQNAVADIKRVPTTEDGSVDYELITDPKMFAEERVRELGSTEAAVADITEAREASEVEITQKIEKAKKLTSINERNVIRKQIEALRNRVALYDEVLNILAPKEVGVIDNQYARQLNEEMIAPIEKVAEKLGVAVNLVDAAKTGNGDIVNGFIKDGKVYITADGFVRRRSMVFLFGHEFTHRAKDLAPEQFKEFKKSVKSYLGEEEWNKRIENMKSLYVRNNMEKKADNAELMEEECTADFVGEMVEKHDAFNNYLSSIQNDTGLLATIKRVIRAIIGFFSGTDEQKRINEMLKQVNALIAAAEKANAKGVNVDAQAPIEVIESAERLEEKGGVVDVQRGDAKFALADVLTISEQEQAIQDLMRVTGRSRATVQKYIKAEQSLARFILSGDNAAYLDYEADDSVPSIWENSDYPQGTVEFSNICRKRLPLTMIYQKLQKEFPNTKFNKTQLETIRQTLIANGIDVACGLCFVEDRRQHNDEIGQGFIDALSGKDVYVNANQQKAIDKLRESGDNYIPNLYELLTLDGMKKLRMEHPDVANAFIKYNNARGQQAGRLFQAYSAYHREILKFNNARVKKTNDVGGLRIFSFSDFEAHHLIDLVQVLTDCARKGIKVQGYTKVPEFALAVKDTGMKLNRSLIAKDNGVVEADYSPKTGEAVSPNVIDGKRLLLDTVEGIDVTDKNFFDSSASKNVGNILVGVNDEQIRIAMLDPFVDYIIPFHTGLSADILKQKGISDWKNYKYEQIEKTIVDGKMVNAKTHINIYTDVLSDDIKTEKQFVERYLEVCKEKNLVPKFARFLNRDKAGDFVYTKGYYKFLLDFKMFDAKGRILPQEVVQPIFNDEVNKQILDDYVKGEKAKAPNEEVYEKAKEALGLGVQPKFSLPVVQGVYDALKEYEASSDIETFVNKVRDVNDNIALGHPFLTNAILDYDEFGAEEFEREVRMIVGDYDGDGYAPYTAGGVKYSISSSTEEFDATRDLAVQNIGIVMPNLETKRVPIVGYNGEERPPIEKSNEEVLDWAKKNIATTESYIIDSNGVRYDCPITANSLTEMLNDRAIKSSVNRNIHMLALPLLKTILANSIEVEIHPDYNKVGKERKPEFGYNPAILMHRFYGAVEIDGVVYRTKSTIKEYRDKNTALKPYTYEVIKIKLLPNSTADANDAHGRPLSIESNSIDASKLLQNVEKSYDKGVKILDESINFSLITPEMDASYLDAVERGDMATAQRMVMEAAKLAMPNTKVVDEDGNPKVVYHQTNATVYINRETGQNWDELDWRERMEWDERDDWDDYWEERDFNTFSRVNARTTQELDGFFFAPEYDEYHEYGDRTIKAFLNIENPASFGDYNIDSSKTNAGRDERIRLQNEGYDGVINEEDGSIWEYIAFEPNQIKSADPVTYDDNGNVIPLSERFNPEKEDIRYSLIGEIGAANIEEYGRYGSPILALEMARELEAQGKSVKAIRLATNWERGVDGKWRYEIMDGKYSHPKDDDITKKRYRLADILDNADLYKAYPYLKDMGVEYDPTLKYYGLYNGKSIKINSLRTEEQIASTLMHEVQHAIQVAETFAISEAPNYSIAETLDKEVDNLVKEFKDTPNANILRKGYLLYKIVKNAINSAKGANKADDAYHKLAGEVEARNVQKRMSMTPEQRLRTLLSATEDVARKDQGIIYQEAMNGVERAEILSKANAKQKIPNANIENDLYTFDDTRYSLRDDIDARIAKKRPDILPEERMEVVEYIMNRGDAKTSKVFAHYFVNGAIRLNEDDDKVMQAIETAKRAKVDPMSFKSPDELLDVHAQFKPKAKPIDPDKVPTLSDKRDYGNGIVTYLVDESQESRENMREIINTHYGKNANPWCLLATDADGKLSESSALAWYAIYNQTPKRVAFYNGKLIAFSASWRSNIAWADRLDKSYTGIPILQRIGDGRNGIRLFDEESGQFIEGYHNIYKGDKRDGIYQEWYTLEQEKLKASYENGKLNGPYIEFYEDGGFKIKVTYKDAKAEGTCKEYYRNGAVYKITTYKDVKLNGLYEEYYKDGTPKIKTFYEDGKLNGPYEEFYEDGTPKIKTTYNDDFVEGGYTEYYRDGAIYIKASYKDGKRDGLYEEYFENGTLSERGTYKDGEVVGLYEAYFENGSLKAKGIFEDGEVVGLYEAYFENGTPRRMERVDGDIKSTELWYPNGQMSTKERVDKDENGDTIAITVTWYDDGTKKSVSSKKNGKPNGEIVNWHPNGNIQYRAIYEDGLLNGRVESYNENGSLNYTEEYKKGRKHGESIRYYPSGDIQSVEEYEGNQRNGVSIVYTENGAIEDVRTYKDGVETNEPLFSLPDMPFFEDNGDVVIFDDLEEEDKRERKPRVTSETLRTYIDGRHYAATQRIRKEASDAKAVARLRLQEERRKRSDKLLSQRSNVGKVNFILGNTPRSALSFYDQALVMIAEGEVGIVWDVDKNGRKGIAAELGLGDGEKKDYRQITKGATLSFEGFVHNWWESLGGYENGIDTQDLRNALIEALSDVSRPSAAINLLRDKFDTPQRDYDNAIADIEASTDQELALEDARYSEEVAEFENGANKAQLTRYYEQNAILQDDIASVRYTIRDLEKKLQRAKREVVAARKHYKDNTKKKLEAQFEKNKEYLSKTIANLREGIESAKVTIKEAISNSNVLKYNSKDMQSIVSSISTVRSPKSLEMVLGRLENTLLNIRIREERNNMQRLLNMRLPNGKLVETWVGQQVYEKRMTATEGKRIIGDMFRGVNSKGVKVAKFVDAHTASVMMYLRNNLVLPISKRGMVVTENEDGTKTKTFTPEQELTQSTETFIAANEAAIAAITMKAEADGGRDYTTAERVELDARELFKQYLNVVKYKYDIAAILGFIEPKKKAIAHRMQIIEEDRAAGKPIEQHLQFIEDSRNVINKIYNNVREFKRNYEKNIVEFNSTIGDILATGRDALKAFRNAKEEHRKEIIRMGLKAIGGKPARLYPTPPTATEKLVANVRDKLHDPYWTFETVCREIDRWAPNGEGEFFNHFVGGAVNASNNLISMHIAHMEQVGAKIQSLWKEHRKKSPYKAYEAVLEKANSQVIGSITYMSKWDGENNVAYGPEKMELFVSNAMYAVAMWRQKQYQETMARHGITDEKMEEIISRINAIDPRYIEFMDFINDTFLPSTRLEYDKVHKQMYGTSMDEIENYFPAQVMRSHEEVDISDTASGALPSTVTRSIISRRPHRDMPNLMQSYFAMLLSHIQDMDHWATYAMLNEDLNILLSNVEFKKRLNEYMSGANNDRTGAGSLYHLFRTRSAIMAGCYQSAKDKTEVFSALTRGFAASNISWRLTTAIKQIASSPVFMAYSINPKCWAIWVKNIVIGTARVRNTFNWAIENSPSFRQRWQLRYSGSEKLEQTARDIRSGIDPAVAKRSTIQKIGTEALDLVEHIAIEVGMAPNAAVDAWTCAAGMKTIYEFEISEMTGGKREATKEEKQKAMRKAEIFMNTTQQSAESAFLSEIQMQGSYMAALATTYMNSPFAFHRLRLGGAQELTRGWFSKEYRKKVIEEYGKGALTAGNRKAVARILQGLIGDVAFFLMAKGMRSLWELLNDAIYGVKDGEDEEEEMTGWGKFWTIARVPVSMALNGFIGGNIASSVVMGFDADFSPRLNDFWEKATDVFDIQREEDGTISDWGFNLWAALSLVSKYGVGVDLKTLLNIVEGIDDINTVEGVMKLFNEPRSAIQLVAGRRRDGETAKQYVERIVALEVLFNEPLFEELFNEDVEFIGEDRLSRIWGLSDQQVRDILKEHNERQLRGVLKGKEFEDVTEIDAKYKEVCERMGWKPDRDPHDDKVDKSGDYSEKENMKWEWIYPENLEPYQYEELKAAAKEAATQHRRRLRFLGTDESLKSILEAEYKLKLNVINVYNEL